MDLVPLIKWIEKIKQTKLKQASNQIDLTLPMDRGCPITTVITVSVYDNFISVSCFH